MKQTFLLEGLDCANCGAKIEKAVNALDGISNASVNFMTTKMVIETETNDTDEIFKSVKKTVKKVEPDVTLKPVNR